MTAITQSKKSANGTIWLVVVSLLALVGVGAWVYQIVEGIGVTNLSNLETWGLYVAGFIFFMGLSGGALVLAALPVILDLPKFRPYAKIAAFVSLSALIAGGLFILIDIGKPMRLWHLVTYGRLGSPLLWDLLLTIAYLIISTVYLSRLLQSERKGGKSPKALAYVALAAGLADGMTALVFATQVAHDYWFSAIQPMSFEVSAVASAGAVLLLLVAVLGRTGYLKPDLAAFKPVAVGTAGLLGLNLLLVVSEIVTETFGRSENGVALAEDMIGSPLFWIEIVAFVLAITLYVLPQVQFSGVVAASALTLIGLAAKRLLFVRMGFSEPNLTYAGVDIGSSSYAPQIVELALSLGLVGLFVLLLTLGFRSLPLKLASKASK
ncbi:MAG TPA: polysulfide reductase NrfD [Aggregatilinea sp.]|uniref:NrfD/PsrC family molybdoenzyme membrane anchor subunit n=1 Tax=Aggregatilinea sp. TaxID=2806333 RepID=UPI002C3BEBD0|nr:NrfD/PsrC family molybdoenzyme membrane anchor subunit [Aggregatilinea sp.]HML20311.1 polysulfide reductase NrfD [Aggregatilinea sp.]